MSSLNNYNNVYKFQLLARSPFYNQYFCFLNLFSFLNLKRDIITVGQYYEQIHMSVVSTMKEGTGNLAYFDKKITLFKTKIKTPVQSYEKS